MKISCHSVFSVITAAFTAITKEITKSSAEVYGFWPKFETGTAWRRSGKTNQFAYTAIFRWVLVRTLSTDNIFTPCRQNSFPESVKIFYFLIMFSYKRHRGQLQSIYWPLNYIWLRGFECMEFCLHSSIKASASDKKKTAGPRQHKHSWFWIPRNSRPYFLSQGSGSLATTGPLYHGSVIYLLPPPRHLGLTQHSHQRR
jgi:hypothetical protein